MLDGFEDGSSKFITEILRIMKLEFISIFDSEIKQQCRIWVFEFEVRTTKVKKVRSVEKKVITSFFNNFLSKSNTKL